MDWSNLPPEILSLIFRLVSVRSVLQSALVCVNWRGSTCDPGLWKALYFSTTLHPAFRPDAKLNWKHLVLRKFIVKHSLKQSKCVVRTVSSKEIKTNDYVFNSLSGDWCTIQEKGDTHVVNIITEESITHKGHSFYLTSGDMMYRSCSPNGLRDIRVRALTETPETKDLSGILKGTVDHVVRNGDNKSPFVAVCFKRGYDDWYNNTGSIFGVWDVHSMKFLYEILENRKIRHIALYQHNLVYYDAIYPCKVVCRNLLTGEEEVILNNQVVHSLAAGSNKIVMSLYDNKMVVLDVNTKVQKTIKITVSTPHSLTVYHDMVVCASDGKVFFIDINNGKLINAINMHESVVEFSELSNGDLAVRTAKGLRVISFQQKLIDKRIRIQAIYQLEHKCHIQEETVSAFKIMEFIGSKVGSLDNISSYLFNVTPTERYGIIFLMKIMGTPVKQKQLRNNYATRLLKKTSNMQGYLPFSFTRSTEYSYYGYRNHRSKSQFVDGHAFLYYERLIDGHWELSSPTKPWPEK